jgi:hypothetical protein
MPCLWNGQMLLRTSHHRVPENLEHSLMKRIPAIQERTILLDIFIHLTETFTYQISMKCNLHTLEAN